MTNQDHAETLLAEATAAMHRRRVLLCASTALGTTKSTTAARRVLTEWDGPAEIRAAAIALIDALAGDPL
jgi:hypothetical protein